MTLLTLALLSALHAAPVADTLSGTWQITGDVVGNPLNEVCTITQEGAKITGSCKSTDTPDAKAWDATGDVTDGKITIKHGGDYQGQPLTITYTGTILSAKAFKGTVDVQPFGVSGEFSAAAAAPKP